MKILLIAGGWSSEREVSLTGARGMQEALVRRGHAVTFFDLLEHFDDLLETARQHDFALINLHGSPGEDGLVQAMLEKADCPYQGSGPSGSFLALNKAAAKQIFRMAGLPTADWEFLPVRPAAGWEPRLPWPLFVKSTTGGSSLRLGRAAIRQELDRQVERYNGLKQDNQINFMGGPITRLDVAIGSEAQVPVALKDYLLETGLLLLFLLLVPALNLLGVIQSAVQKRRAEMGVRKAFGATTGTLLCQVLYENGLTTLIGGVVGFGLSLLFFSLGKGFLLESADTSLSGEMLFQPMAFGAALLFCLLLNLLSAGIPALRIARQKIVTALKDGEEFNK